MAREPAWEKWLGIHGSRLMLYARQLTRSESDAEDVLQCALVKTWRNARDPRDPESCRGLIFTNIRREAIDLGRGLERRRRRDECFIDEQRAGGGHVAWFHLPEDDESRQLQVALASIPAKFREVITLKIWGDLTFSEIGTALEISPNTAASRYRYGLETLRTRLVTSTH